MDIISQWAIVGVIFLALVGLGFLISMWEDR